MAAVPVHPDVGGTRGSPVIHAGPASFGGAERASFGSAQRASFGGAERASFGSAQRASGAGAGY
jgi:hypothetical protein